MISVNPPYAQMIMNGFKFVEFRKNVLNILKNDDLYLEEKEMPKAYIYETKNKKGIGQIIGECRVLHVYKPMYCLESGGGYTKSFINGEIVKKRNELIKDLYRGWCCDNNIKYNANEGWFKSKKFSTYLNEIGWENSKFNYALYLTNFKKYQYPKDIKEFLNEKGEIMTRPPQNMCRVAFIPNVKEDDFLDEENETKQIDKANCLIK